jgi:hypothetical protein
MTNCSKSFGISTNKYVSEENPNSSKSQLLQQEKEKRTIDVGAFPARSPRGPQDLGAYPWALKTCKKTSKGDSNTSF